MDFISLFTGVGGFDLGFERAGMQCVAQVENDKFARQVLNYRYTDVPKFEDVKHVGQHNLPAADVICGGFPCQDVSIAGNRRGFAGERSSLWFEFRRIAGEIKPEWVVVENVPGLLSSNAGADFATVLRGLVELGYRVAWRILDSQHFGVPQRRRRLFIVGHFGSGRAAQVLFDTSGMSGNHKPRTAARKRITATAYDGTSITSREKALNHEPKLCYTLHGRARESIIVTATAFDTRSMKSNGQISGTLQAKSSGGYSLNYINPILQRTNVRRLTPRECERLQGFPDDWTAICSDSQRYKQLGNAITVPVAKWIGDRLVACSSAHYLHATGEDTSW